MTNYLEELGKKQREKLLYIDNQSVILLVENLVYYLKTKYIKRWCHFTRMLVEECDMCLDKIESASNLEECPQNVNVWKLRLYTNFGRFNAVKILMMSVTTGKKKTATSIDPTLQQILSLLLSQSKSQVPTTNLLIISFTQNQNSWKKLYNRILSQIYRHKNYWFIWGEKK